MALSLRLAEVLRKHLQQEDGSYSKLAMKIGIDRRRLSTIIRAPKNLMLSLEELEHLDTYLLRDSEGLAEKPLFSRPGILNALAQENVTFFVGARSRSVGKRSERVPYSRSYLSVWDVQAYSAVQDRLNKSHLMSRCTLRTVKQDSPSKDELEKQLDNLGPDTAICSVGAPRSCPMSELMLARMFGIGDEAFTPMQQLSSPVPFCFVWPPRRKVPSRFALSCDKLSDKHTSLRQDIVHGNAWAFLLDGEAAGILRWDENPLTDYGLVVAQRRSTRQFWLVVAGLSGPGTLAAAQALIEQLELKVPRVPEEPEVLWVAVKASVRIYKEQEKLGDGRESSMIA